MYKKKIRIKCNAVTAIVTHCYPKQSLRNVIIIEIYKVATSSGIRGAELFILKFNFTIGLLNFLPFPLIYTLTVVNITMKVITSFGG